MNFKEILCSEFLYNPFTVVGKEWLLITAEKNGKVNTMTASWGGFGHMWNKDVVNIVVRQSRYTKEFIDNADSFSISVLDKEKYLEELMYLGRVSGRDEDKITKSKLNVKYKDSTPYFQEANKVVICKKLFSQTLDYKNLIDEKLQNRFYEDEDNHSIYFGEVLSILIK